MPYAKNAKTPLLAKRREMMREWLSGIGQDPDSKIPFNITSDHAFELMGLFGLNTPKSLQATLDRIRQLIGLRRIRVPLTELDNIIHGNRVEEEEKTDYHHHVPGVNEQGNTDILCPTCQRNGKMIEDQPVYMTIEDGDLFCAHCATAPDWHGRPLSIS